MRRGVHQPPRLGKGGHPDSALLGYSHSLRIRRVGRLLATTSVATVLALLHAWTASGMPFQPFAGVHLARASSCTAPPLLIDFHVTYWDQVSNPFGGPPYYFPHFGGSYDAEGGTGTVVASGPNGDGTATFTDSTGVQPLPFTGGSTGSEVQAGTTWTWSMTVTTECGMAQTVLVLTVPSSATGPPPPSTYAETTGGVANTWSNYVNAGGTHGPTIPALTTVQIACKVMGFKVADGNTWWYRIAQAPWSGAFYVSADAFYNNGATSGSLRGTPFLDPDVPDCGSSTPPPTGSFSETASIHHVVHTFADYHDASGQGPDIGVGQVVQVSCKVYDPTIASVNPDGYWYRIASSPWNDNYYAPANTFLDGDPPNGPYTHNTDFAVPDCVKSGASSTRPTVTVAKGPAARFGFRYAVTLSGFAANAAVAISCRDSVDPGGFFNFDMRTDASGSGFVQNECYSADGPDHWVVADGQYVSNRVQWGSGAGASPPTTTGPPSVAGPTAPRHFWIVTLGDSYTAGNGAGANYDSPCHRSYNSYPWLYMNRLRGAGYSTDIWQAACSGATTADVFSQVKAALASPAKNQAGIVYLTIGGNDLNFHSVVEWCLLPVSGNVLSVSNCSGLIDTALGIIPTTIDTTRAILQDIANKMPHAQIVLLGYPVLTKPTCPNTPWNQTIASAQSAFDADQQTMVTKLNRADGTSRFHFVSIAQIFSGHGPCTSASSQYVRGVDVTADGNWPSYHPNLTGDEVIANLLYSTGVQNWVSQG